MRSLIVVCVICAFALAARCGADPAPASFESFESDAVPNGWTASGGVIETTGDRYKSGARSLRWTWDQAGATLTYRNPAAFANRQVPAEKKPGSAFALWLHNDSPTPGVMRVDILSGEVVVGGCWFQLDYQGWRPLGAPYAEVMGNPDLAVDGLRLHVPEGIDAGVLYLDYATFDLVAAVPRSCQMPWIGIENGLKTTLGVAGPACDDIASARPWLPARVADEEVTDREREGMTAIAERSLPTLGQAGAGVAPEIIAGLRARMSEWNIVREDGRITGRPVDYASFIKPPDAVTLADYMTLCGEVKDAYALAGTPEDREALARMFVTLSEHFLDQGWGYGSGLRGAGNGYVYRAWPRIFYPMREVLAEAGIVREVALSLVYQMGGSEGALAEEPWGSMDTLHLSNQALLPCISMLPDEAERLQWLRAIQRYYSLVLVNRRTLGPDGCAYHHWMHHYAYASYSMPFPIRAAHAMADTVFRISPEAHENLRRYVYAMAFATCDGRQPPNMNGRAGTPQSGNPTPLAKLLAEMGPPDGSELIDAEMAGLYLALTDAPDEEPARSWREQGIEPVPLAGHVTMNGTAASLHRRDDWLVSIVGMIKFWRGVEIYGWIPGSNNYARYARNGAIFVASSGDPVSIEASGYSYDGWDWCHWPGTTSLIRPSHEIFAGYTMFTNPTPTAGGTDLDGDGVWGMDFESRDVNFRKSAFCFDDHITVITTGISSDQDRPAVTTLWQNTLDPAGEAVWVDGEQMTDFPWEGRLDDEDAHWLIDNKRTGYFVHAGHDPINIFLHRQQWTYMIKRYLKDPDDNPIINYQKRRYRHEDMAENERYFNPSAGDFALARFDHGTQPTDASCAWTMLVDTTPEVMARFAAAMSEPTTAPCAILQADAQAHVVRDRDSATVGYAVFEADAELPSEGALRSVNRPCFVMIATDDEGLRVSVASTDIASEEPIILRIAGDWRLAANDSVVANVEAGVTVLEITPDYYMPMIMQLLPE